MKVLVTFLPGSMVDSVFKEFEGVESLTTPMAEADYWSITCNGETLYFNPCVVAAVVVQESK